MEDKRHCIPHIKCQQAATAGRQALIKRFCHYVVRLNRLAKNKLEEAYFRSDRLMVS
jgi:hypothetical protein